MSIEEKTWPSLALYVAERTPAAEVKALAEGGRLSWLKPKGTCSPKSIPNLDRDNAQIPPPPPLAPSAPMTANRLGWTGTFQSQEHIVENQSVPASMSCLVEIVPERTAFLTIIMPA